MGRVTSIPGCSSHHPLATAGSPTACHLHNPHPLGQGLTGEREAGGWDRLWAQWSWGGLGTEEPREGVLPQGQGCSTYPREAGKSPGRLPRPGLEALLGSTVRLGASPDGY